MDFGKATNLDVLLDSLVTQIATVTGIEKYLVIPTLVEQHFAPGGPGDKYVLLTNFRGDSNQALVAGGGIDATEFRAAMDVVLLVRLDLDQVGRDTQRLVHAQLGLLPMWRKVLKAAQMWSPTDGAATPVGLLTEPARVGAWSIRSRNFADTNGWVQIRTTLMFSFLQDLS